jgi:hypothetical protein
MPENRDYDVNRELVELLLEKIDEDTYPSTTMMDLVEEILEPHMVERYARTLLEKASRDTYPSMALLNRIRGLA